MPLKEIKKLCCQFEWWNRDLILLKINPVRGWVNMQRLCLSFYMGLSLYVLSKGWGAFNCRRGGNITHSTSFTICCRIVARPESNHGPSVPDRWCSIHWATLFNDHFISDVWCEKVVGKVYLTLDLRHKLGKVYSQSINLLAVMAPVTTVASVARQYHANPGSLLATCRKEALLLSTYSVN